MAETLTPREQVNHAWVYGPNLAQAHFEQVAVGSFEMISGLEGKIRVIIGVLLLGAAIGGLATGGADFYSPGVLTFLISSGIMLTRMGVKSQ